MTGDKGKNGGAQSKDSDTAVLSIEHNVIEHLGIKLYKNKYGNVLAELIANSWDADAEKVDVVSSSGLEDGETPFLVLPIMVRE